MAETIHTEVMFQLLAPHPHAGEYAHGIGQTPGTITTTTVCGEERFLLLLIDCPHRVERCYAAKGQLRLLQSYDPALPRD